MNEAVATAAPAGSAAPAWGAVFSMALGVFGLVTAEFLPASLLTPMAADLGVTEGLAGQAVTATAAIGLLASLLIPAATRGLDRRVVLLGFSGLLVASNLLAAVASSLPVLIAARLVLGVALGGFWAMSTATVMRLVPEAAIPRALSMVFGGVSAATVAAAPLGSFLGDQLGWRAVFLMAAGLGLAAFLAQYATLPRMAASATTRFGTLVLVLRRPRVGAGMVAVLMVFTGHFAVFTYVRPFLETVTGVGIQGVSAILLGFGLANFLGTGLAGPAIARNLKAVLVAMPALMVVLGLGLVLAGGTVFGDAVMLALWGMAFGAVPVAWSTWLTRAAPDEAESGGGLIVAAIQLAIATGAAAGGVIFDLNGAPGVFLAATLVLAAAALLILTRVRIGPRAAVRQAGVERAGVRQAGT
ncbi:MFS transporter [Tistrella mobilis]|uniref:MFS transporter n=1 Tax=Tistrella mobilis TaxID=171437 RepID=UPI0031F71B03